MKVLNFGSLNIDYGYDVDKFVTEGETKSSLIIMFMPAERGVISLLP